MEHNHKGSCGDCGCGHDHHHDSCGCGHDHHHGHHTHTLLLSAEEADFIKQLSVSSVFEVVRFVMKSSKSSHFESTALAPVHLKNKNDSMEKVKETADVLQYLQEQGVIDIDYDTPVEGSDYALYQNSELYAYFVQTIEESKAQPNFIFDIPHMECGRLTLTALGRAVRI